VSKDEPIIYSGEWWQSRSDEQLNEILRGSFPTSPAFNGAVAERDRRSGEKRETKDRRVALWSLIFAAIAAATGIAALFI
jgi:hypothetical protein